MTIKPRVLFILGILWGKNGVTLHLETLAKKLIEYGWEVGIASGVPSTSRLTGEKTESISAIQSFNAIGVEHFFIPFPALYFSSSNIKNSFESLIKLNAVIQRFKPDIMHIHSFSVCPFAYLMRQSHHIPYVLTCHLEPSKSRRNLFLAGLANNYFRAIFGNRIIAISSDIRNAFEQMNMPAESIRLIYHGVDNRHFRPPSSEERLKARDFFGLSPQAKIVCLIGRLDIAVKGHDILIHAIAKLRSEGLEAITLCAGQGHGIGENMIQKIASESGVADLVHLLGFADTRQVLWASDIIILPSRREGFALVIPEAMLCGIVPVRTPAAGASDQIEDGINGFIVPFNDPEALALQLRKLLESDKLRAKISAFALKSAQKKFTAVRMAKDTISVYEEVI
jgi:glycosyltransferase involved in cell wall biosynthesis